MPGVRSEEDVEDVTRSRIIQILSVRHWMAMVIGGGKRFSVQVQGALVAAGDGHTTAAFTINNEDNVSISRISITDVKQSQ